MPGLHYASGDGLTRGNTNDTCAAAGTKAIVAAAASVQARLHGLTITMDTAAANGAWQIEDSDSNVLWGPHLAPSAGGGIDVHLSVGKLTSLGKTAAIGKGLQVRATGANLHFLAEYSTGAS